MVLCSCFRPSARYENEVETSVPQIIPHDLDVAKQAPDAAPAPSPAARLAGKAAVDQTARDTNAEADKVAPVKAVPSPKPVLDAQTSIWEKLASHEIRNLSPTPEPREVTPGPETCTETAEASTEARKTPDLTITGTSIKPIQAAGGVTPVSAKKPWGVRAAPSSGGANPTTPPSSRRSSSTGGARKSGAGASPASVPASLLKPTAASAARAQATVKPRSDEAVWKC